MFKTKTYNLSKNEYVKIVVKKRFKKSWWIYLLLMVLAIFHIKNFGHDNFSTFFVIFAFSYPLLVIIWLYFWAISKEQDANFEDTNMEFDKSHLFFKRNGNETKIPIENIKRVISKNEYWMLYLSKREFIYVKKDIFFSGEDYLSFCKLINVET